MPNTCIRFNDHDIIKQKVAKASRYLNLFTTMEEPSVFGTEGYRMANFCHNNGLYDFYGGENPKDSYNLGTVPFTLSFWLKFKDTFCNKDESIFPNKLYLGMNHETIYEVDLTLDTKAHHYCVERDKNKTMFVFIDGVKVLEQETDLPFNMDDESFLFIGNDVKNTFGDEFYADDIYLWRNQILFDTTGFTPPTGYLYAPSVDYFRIMENEDNGYGLLIEV